MALFFIRLAAATLVMSAVALVSAAQAAPPADAIVAMPRFTVEVVGEVGPDVILIPGLATPREVWRRSPTRSRAGRGCTWSSCAASAPAIRVPMRRAAQSPGWWKDSRTISRATS